MSHVVYFVLKTMVIEQTSARCRRFNGPLLTCGVGSAHSDEREKRINRRADSGDDVTPWMRRPKILQILSRTAVHSIISRRCYNFSEEFSARFWEGNFYFVSRKIIKFTYLLLGVQVLFSHVDGKEWHVLP